MCRFSRITHAKQLVWGAADDTIDSWIHAAWKQGPRETSEEL